MNLQQPNKAACGLLISLVAGDLDLGAFEFGLASDGGAAISRTVRCARLPTLRAPAPKAAICNSPPAIK
ncbi:hypothetical protein ABIB68_007097 [Bradyrhizobium sp. F1.2.2]